jgi:selenoprotein W-related protein
VGLADELLKKFEPEIESISLVPSNGSRFEISLNGQLIYSKLKTGRHVEPGEVIGLVQKFSKKKMHAS